MACAISMRVYVKNIMKSFQLDGPLHTQPYAFNLNGVGGTVAVAILHRYV